MLTPETKNVLEKTARELCRKNHLIQVYFAQPLGRRQHYLAGYGEENYTSTEHLVLSKNLALFWQGILSEEEKWLIQCNLIPLAEIVEHEMELL